MPCSKNLVASMAEISDLISFISLPGNEHPTSGVLREITLPVLCTFFPISQVAKESLGHWNLTSCRFLYGARKGFRFL